MKKIKLNIVALFIILIFNASCIYATQDVTDYIQNLMGRLLSITQNVDTTGAEKTTQLESLINTDFDLDLLSSLVLGRNKYKLSESQIKEFTELYKKYVKTYCIRMIENFNSSSIKVKSAHSNGSQFIVKTEIIRNNSKLIKVDLLVHHTSSGYKIFNIIIEGINLVASQGAEISSIINGQGIDYLMNDLKDKSNLE